MSTHCPLLCFSLKLDKSSDSPGRPWIHRVPMSSGIKGVEDHCLAFIVTSNSVHILILRQVLFIIPQTEYHHECLWINCLPASNFPVNTHCMGSEFWQFWPESVEFFKKSVICGEWAGAGSSTWKTSPIVTANIKAVTKKVWDCLWKSVMSASLVIYFVSFLFFKVKI